MVWRYNTCRVWIFTYLIITTVSFIYLYSSGFPECTQQEIQHLTEKYKRRIETNEKLIQKLSLQIQHLKDGKCGQSKTSQDELTTIYIITPTHTHPEQKANLVRLSHTLTLVKKVHWIIVEDSPSKTTLTSNFLAHCGLPYTHLTAVTPPEIKLKYNDPTWLKPKGVLQRNTALQWIRSSLTNKDEGVVYFADDDNTYSLEMFEEMRSTKKVSVWPVGLVGGLRYEKPVVENGKVTGWFTYWKPDRPFPMDMAGFAVNLKLFFQYPDAKFSNEVPRGYLESTILKQLHIQLGDLEPKASDCTKVLVWHTRTEKTKLNNEKKMLQKYGHSSDPSIEV